MPKKMVKAKMVIRKMISREPPSLSRILPSLKDTDVDPTQSQLRKLRRTLKTLTKKSQHSVESKNQTQVLLFLLNGTCNKT
jgi:phage terminase Nu1 subunit (DNA packaging protein)